MTRADGIGGTKSDPSSQSTGSSSFRTDENDHWEQTSEKCVYTLLGDFTYFDPFRLVQYYVGE